MKLFLPIIFIGTLSIDAMERQFPSHLPRPLYSYNNNHKHNSPYSIIDPSIESGQTTPLHKAAFAGDGKAVNEIIGQASTQQEKIVLVNARNECCLTPLHHIAARYDVTQGHLEVAALLIHAGALVNTKDSGWRTPLHEVSLWNYTTDLAELLINSGADVNAKDVYGNTPLHETSRTVHLLTQELEDVRARTAALLISHKARMDEKNEMQKTPVDFAIEDFHIPVLVTYINHGVQFVDVLRKVKPEFWPYLAYCLSQQPESKVGTLWVKAVMREHGIEE